MDLPPAFAVGIPTQLTADADFRILPRHDIALMLVFDAQVSGPLLINILAKRRVRAITFSAKSNFVDIEIDRC
jgi:hypothetical protein